MSRLVPWVARKFAFDFPVNLYPNVFARVRGAPPRLEDAVRELSHEQLILRREGTWSIQENAGHLLDEEDLFRRRLQEFLDGADTLTPAPYRTVELHHNERPIGDILSDFRKARQRQLEVLNVLQPEDFARIARHERLKLNMRLVDHLFFMAEHDDHHLARIWELRNT